MNSAINENGCPLLAVKISIVSNHMGLNSNEIKNLLSLEEMDIY